MPSHLGFESAISKDCPTLTRSLPADNSPYYQAGLKLGYTSRNEKLYLAALCVNGWQRIQRIPGNHTPAIGTQIMYKPNGKTTLNYSTFIGNDKPDSARQMRYYNDLYGIFQFNKLGLTFGVDYGIEQRSQGSSDYNSWYGLAGIIRYQPFRRTAIVARAEYYSDEHGVIISTGTPNGFKTSGYSLGFDYYIMDNVLFRVEGKVYYSKDDIFPDSRGTSDKNEIATTSLAVSF